MFKSQLFKNPKMVFKLNFFGNDKKKIENFIKTGNVECSSRWFLSFIHTWSYNYIIKKLSVLQYYLLLGEWSKLVEHNKFCYIE